MHLDVVYPSLIIEDAMMLLSTKVTSDPVKEVPHVVVTRSNKEQVSSLYKHPGI